MKLRLLNESINPEFQWDDENTEHMRMSIEMWEEAYKIAQRDLLTHPDKNDETILVATVRIPKMGLYRIVWNEYEDKVEPITGFPVKSRFRRK